MVVGASKPAVVADADGFFSVKSKMQVRATSTISIREVFISCQFNV